MFPDTLFLHSSLDDFAVPLFYIHNAARFKHRVIQQERSIHSGSQMRISHEHVLNSDWLPRHS